MTGSIWAALIWLVVANVAGLLPSRDNHWMRAYGLIATGIPILIWLIWDAQYLVAAGFCVGAVSILRWPVVYLGRWLRGRAVGSDAKTD